MKKLITIISAVIVAISISSIAQARDTKYLLPINTAMDATNTQGKLDGSIKFYFGDQNHPQVIQDLGTVVTNPKTNSFGKSDQRACNWAFLSAMIALQNRARQLGGNAVINIVSYYKKNEMSSNDQFECHAGGIIAGVALKGDIVKIAAK